MVKTCKNMCFSLYPLDFFKIYLPDQSSHHMKFPPECLKCCDCIVPLKSMISTKKGSWRVDLEDIDKNLYFKNGWEQFVQDNSLQFGDFLLFSYSGNGKFYVKIYGRDGCEKEATHYTEESSRGFLISDNNQKDDNSENLCGKRVGRPRVVAKKKTTLSFEVVMKKYHERYLTIAKAFIFGAGIEQKTFVLLFKNGKLWPVNICKRTHAGSYGRTDTGTGWRKFWNDNKLTIDNKCMFKFVPGSGNIIQVDITAAM